MGKRLTISVLTIPFLLGACGANDSAEGPGGVTADEARALNEAAAMLDARAENTQTALSGNSAE
jgi:hypothetical protein